MSSWILSMSDADAVWSFSGNLMLV